MEVVVWGQVTGRDPQVGIYMKRHGWHCVLKTDGCRALAAIRERSDGVSGSSVLGDNPIWDRFLFLQQ